MPPLSELFFSRPSQSPSDGDSGEDAPRARPGAAGERFASYNRHRRQRLDAQLGERAREAVLLLPVLLHVNQPGLPGYVDNPQCPVGIADYSPSHADLALVRRLFPDSQARRTGVLRPVIELVAVMGSVGTIGFSGDSDLDVWVCYHPGHLAGPGRGLYEAKVRAVERWMGEHGGAEVHLFLQDAERVRQNDFGEADLEGCGSAMGALLKEEFYRTGILLAGKVPAWWLQAPGERATRAVEEPGEGVADLGPVASVPLGELFGAAIWQIVKSWKSPFKSALKMGLLEKAVLSGSRFAPLCEVLKAQVLSGARPDPYRLLFDEVLSHYHAQGDLETEDLLARCFYLKTGIRLEPDAVASPGSLGGDEAVLAEYVRAWGWGARRVRHLNQLADWKFEWVQSLAKEIDRFFLRTYQRIRKALDESGETQRITPRDLTILGRKLQVAYRRVANKVEVLHLETGGVSEAQLTLFHEVLPNGEAAWSLFRGAVSGYSVEERNNDVLRTSPDPLELLVWAARNQILSPATRLSVKGTDRDGAASEAESVGLALAAFVAEAAQDRSTLDALLEKPAPVRLLVVPNFGRDEEHLTVLGGLWTTTWGETFYRRWEGGEAFREFAEELFLPFLRESADPTRLQVAAPSRRVGAGRGAHSRVQRELPGLGAFLGARQGLDGVRRRYVGAAVSGYYVLERTAKDLSYRGLPDREALFRHLSGVGPYRKTETVVENVTGHLAILRGVLEAATPGLVDVFSFREGDRETLFVVDEVGNFIHFPRQAEGYPYGLAKLLVFLEHTLPLVAAQKGAALAGTGLDDAVRIHALVHEGTCRVFTSTFEHIARARALGLQPMGLTIERTVGRGGPGYAIQWGDQEIRSGDVANPLEELRRLVLQKRKSKVDYEVFVTRLFLDDRFVAANCGNLVTTGHYLFYKKAIEQRLSA